MISFKILQHKNSNNYKEQCVLKSAKPLTSLKAKSNFNVLASEKSNFIDSVITQNKTSDSFLIFQIKIK